MDYLSAEFIDNVYYTLQGELIPEVSIPDVENLFAAGSPCELAYTELHNAYDRLLLRLKEQDDDSDIETIIGSMLTISKHLGRAMYLYGVKYAVRSSCENLDIYKQTEASQQVDCQLSPLVCTGN